MRTDQQGILHLCRMKYPALGRASFVLPWLFGCVIIILSHKYKECTT